MVYGSEAEIGGPLYRRKDNGERHRVSRGSGVGVVVWYKGASPQSLRRGAVARIVKKFVPTARRKLARPLRPDKVRAMVARGLSPAEIAAVEGVRPSAVYQHLERWGIRREQIEEFLANRGAILASIQSEGLSVIQKIVRAVNNDRVLDSLTPKEKVALLVPINVVVGTLYDKERLERGKSTANVGLLAKLMGRAQGKLFDE